MNFVYKKYYFNFELVIYSVVKLATIYFTDKKAILFNIFSFSNTSWAHVPRPHESCQIFVLLTNKLK